ncbi:MAG: sugar transferase [Acidobacteriota bacterium]
MYRSFLKRALDVVLTLVVLCCLSPVLLVVALLVEVWLGSPVLFRQRRPGKDGIPFTLLKFRTMTPAEGLPAETTTDDLRLGRFGRWLRRTSLDELPELWNVFIGDMSLVGPRPLLMEYLPLYSPEQARRHEVRPGLTGWAQVSGRNSLSWEEKFRLDVEYVEHYSLSFDLKILLKTVLAVASGRGVSAEGSATMPAFTGTPK